MQMRRKIEDKLLELGVMPNLKGFTYACEAVEYILSSKDYAIGKIYENVAMKHQFANYTNVERGIRYAITQVDKNTWRSMGGKGLKNFEFLYILAAIVKREIEDENIERK